MKKFAYSVLAILCPYLVICQAQQIKIRVISQDKQPVADATIIHFRTGFITITDRDGKFSIPGIQPTDSLQVSAAGYIAKTVITSPHDIILIRDVKNLEEVVLNTGYETIPKERATGSFTNLDNELLNQQISTGIMSRLINITNGLQVASGRVGTGEIIIRGLSTFSGPQDPLIILDNFPYEGDLQNINPNDVESITILKDAAAASIWGAKSGNGVIVINTKRARFNNKVKIELTTNLSLIKKPDLSGYPHISSTDFIDVEHFLFSKKYRFADTLKTDRPAFSRVYEILFRKNRGELTESQANEEINLLRKINVWDQYEQHVYSKSVNKQVALTASGGSAAMAWLISAGYDQNIDELSATYKRLNVRMQNSFHLSDRWELNLGVYVTESKSKNGRQGLGSISYRVGGLAPYTRLADNNGNSLPVYNDKSQTFLDTAGGGKLLDWRLYPLDDHNHVNNTTVINHLNATAGIKYKITGYLNANIIYRLEQQQSENRILNKEESWFSRNLINTYSQINHTTGLVNYKVPIGGVLDLYNNKMNANSLRVQLNVDKSLSNHHITLLTGIEISENKTTGNSYRTYGYNPDILTFSNVDFTNTYPDFMGTPRFIPNVQDFSMYVNRFVSFYANGAYVFQKKYTLSGSARKDASNLFGVNTNDKWTPLWSAGIAWDIAAEKFYRFKAIPYLKLRTTFGYRGNIDPSMTGVTTFSYNGTNAFLQRPFGSVRDFFNPELRWEKVGMLNMGIDFSNSNKRLQGSIDYFRKNGKDLFGVDPIDITTGLQTSQITKNVAALKGEGFDLELRTINIEKQITWSTHFNLSMYKDKVTKYYSSSANSNSFVGGGKLIKEGQPIFSYFAYKWAGLDPLTGDPMGYLDGQVSKDYLAITGSGTKVSDLVHIGSSIPVVFGSLGNTFRWRNFSASAWINYKLGYYFRRESIDYSSLFSQARGHTDYTQRWQKTGDELITNVPSMVYPAPTARESFYNFSEVLAERGDHIRLQYINLSYEIKIKRLPNLPLEKLNIQLVINNLGILWRANKLGIDSEYRATDILPPTSFSFGIKTFFK